MGELDLTIRRARAGLADIAENPRLSAAAAAARRSLQQGDPDAMLRSAETLLEARDEPGGESLRLAVSGLAGAARLIGPDRSALRFYSKLTSQHVA
jgi:hypothetical protein